MGPFFATVAEQVSLVLADQIEEMRLLAGAFVGRIDASFARTRDRLIDACYDVGIIPRCDRCGELVHEPEPIVAGRCPRCDHIVDCAGDGQLDARETQFTDPARVNRKSGSLDDISDRGVRCAPIFCHGGGI